MEGRDSMTIEEMKQKKKEYGYSYIQMSELSGVPLGTVQKIFCGATESPRYETLQALERIFRQHKFKYSTDDLCRSDMLCESVAPYFSKKQGEYTVEDYYALPDDCRAELIDGVFYDMATPRVTHQLIAGEIYHQLKLFVKSRKGSCLPMMAPTSVQLDCDDKTMVEPDVFVLCDRSKFRSRCVYGAPDFVVEILSPSTRRKDTVIKLNKYMDAGVREFWLVDPDRKMVLVYHFSTNNYPVIYGFDDEIPVGIWDGECRIDFHDVMEDAAFLYQEPDE